MILLLGASPSEDLGSSGFRVRQAEGGMMEIVQYFLVAVAD